MRGDTKVRSWNGHPFTYIFVKTSCVLAPACVLPSLTPSANPADYSISHPEPVYTTAVFR